VGRCVRGSPCPLFGSRTNRAWAFERSGNQAARHAESIRGHTHGDADPEPCTSMRYAFNCMRCRQPCRSFPPDASDGPPKTPPKRPSANESRICNHRSTLMSLKNQGDPLREPKGAEQCKRTRGATEWGSL